MLERRHLRIHAHARIQQLHAAPLADRFSCVAGLGQLLPPCDRHQMRTGPSAPPPRPLQVSHLRCASNLGLSLEVRFLIRAVLRTLVSHLKYAADQNARYWSHIGHALTGLALADSRLSYSVLSRSSGRALATLASVRPRIGPR